MGRCVRRRPRERALDWLLEEAVDPEPCRGPERVDAVAHAAERSRSSSCLRLLRRGRGGSRSRTRTRFSARPFRCAISGRPGGPWPIRGCPMVTSHGDFHRGNVLVRGRRGLGRGLGALRGASRGLRPDAVLGDARAARKTGSYLFEAAVSSIGAARRPRASPASPRARRADDRREASRRRWPSIATRPGRAISSPCCPVCARRQGL